MSYYVKRTSKSNPAGFSFVGPIKSGAQAVREVEAWHACGETATVLESSDSVKAEVRMWQKVTHAKDAREIVTFHGEQMTVAQYRLKALTSA